MISIRRKTLQTSRHDRGTVVLEFLLAFPIAFLFVLAIAEFGLFLSHAKQIDAAAYAGAREAGNADQSRLPDVLAQCRQRVDRTLQTAGLHRACVVMIEHNVPGAEGERQVLVREACSIRGGGPLPRSGNVYSVRCTVVLPMRHLAPDLLSWVGFSLRDRYSAASVTVPWAGAGPSTSSDNDDHHGGPSQEQSHGTP